MTYCFPNRIRLKYLFLFYFFDFVIVKCLVALWTRSSTSTCYFADASWNISNRNNRLAKALENSLFRKKVCCNGIFSSYDWTISSSPIEILPSDTARTLIDVRIKIKIMLFYAFPRGAIYIQIITSLLVLAYIHIFIHIYSYLYIHMHIKICSLFCGTCIEPRASRRFPWD